ncbi:hypothetical protein predicted by Glimmer/Critica [Limosilactobacillus fermentum]|nr:hypothetical protein predicted by Glimmer/Critica [Limosilactobacillus fermentum]
MVTPFKILDKPILPSFVHKFKEALAFLIYRASFTCFSLACRL